MKRITLRDRIRYEFDNTMSKGSAALIGWLFLLSASLVVFVSMIVFATGIDPQMRGFAQIVWASLLRTLDAGTMGGDTGSWPFLLAMFSVTLGGIFVVSTLIGLLTTGIQGRLEQLRQGRSFVAEEGHTVILGWSPQIFTVLSELVIANANQPRACLAVLAEKDKVEMEEEIRARIKNTGRTRIICRTGNPIDLADLEIVNPHGARALIILPTETEDPDADVIKVILALTGNPDLRADRHHIVAVLRDPKNLDVARLVGEGEVQLLLADDVIARIAAQACCQPGLSVVYTELLDFSGDEIYFHAEPALVGKTFGEALLAYEASALIGLFSQGSVRLNPPPETRIERGDQVIAISEDDDTVRLSGLTEVGIDATAICETPAESPPPKQILLLSWNRRAPTIIRTLDNYATPGSEITVVARGERIGDAQIQAQLEAVALRNTKIVFRAGDPTDRRTLEELALPSYHHVIVLACFDTLDLQEADARTLVTLLHLRDIAKHYGHPFSIVSEMLDVRNRDLAEVTRADDFIVSDRLISLMLSQIAENKELGALFQELLNPTGSELYVRPAERYVQLGRPLNFYTVVEAARRRREVAIGYRRRGEAHEVIVNPDKSRPLTFSAGDQIIVLAEQ